MTSFNVGGRYIDLPENFKLQFVKKNPLFAFDELECERSTSFSIPKTPNNMQILGFANDYHRNGNSMRVRINAQMQSGTVVKDGYLYVSKFSGDSFNCIFVTGELLYLQSLRELGDVSKYIANDYGITVGSSIVTPAQALRRTSARVEYETNGDVLPSWLFQGVIIEAIENNDVPIEWGDTLDRLAHGRIVIPEHKGMSLTPVVLSRHTINQQTPTAPYPQLNTSFIVAYGNEYIDNIFEREVSTYTIIKSYSETSTYYRGYVEQISPLQDITLKFPEETSEDVFIGYVLSSGAISFLGDYSFQKVNGQVIRQGEPLAGRSVDIPFGQPFVVICPDDYLGSGGYVGWQMADVDIKVHCEVSGKDDQPNGAFIRMRDNLPEMTIIEMLKSVAALTGKLLSVRDGNIVFVDIFTNGEILYIKDAIKWSDLKRTFADYSQENTVEFDSDEFVKNRVIASYTIENVNIDESSVLQTLPFSESDVAGTEEQDAAYISNNNKSYIFVLNEDGYLRQARLPKNENLQNVLTNSTSIDIVAPMQLFGFEKIKPDKLFWYDGAVWVWTQAQWSNDEVKLSLSRVDV